MRQDPRHPHRPTGRGDGPRKVQEFRLRRQDRATTASTAPRGGLRWGAIAGFLAVAGFAAATCLACTSGETSISRADTDPTLLVRDDLPSVGPDCLTAHGEFAMLHAVSETGAGP